MIGFRLVGVICLDIINTYVFSSATCANGEIDADGLKLFDRYYLGPYTMPLSLFSRCCGPEENMKYQVNAEWFEKRVQSLKKTLQSNDDMPPLIVHFVDHSFELCDGNHRFEALTQLGVKEYPVIVWITEKDEYEEFVGKYTP